MKWFYIISLLVTAGMVASPFWLLDSEDEQRIASVVVGYTGAGEPILKHNPVIRYDNYPSAIRSIDATTCGDTSSSSLQAEFYEGLYTYHYLLRDEGRPIIMPALAADMPEISDDLLTYTIRLKKGVRYHRNRCFGMSRPDLANTRTVRAQDFVLAFQRVADYYNTRADLSWSLIRGRLVGLDAFREKTKADYHPGDFSRYELPVAGVRALDDHTLQFRLNKPYPQFNMVLAMHLYAPCPHEAVEYWLTGQGTIPPDHRTVTFKDEEMIVGTGAYYLHTWKRKHKIVLKRNPEYRRERYPTVADLRRVIAERNLPEAQLDWLDQQGLLKDAGKELPFNDAVSLTFVAETYPSWMLFLSRQSDGTGIPREVFESIVTPGKDLTDRWRERNIYMRKAWQPTLYWMVFNMRDPVFNASPSLRQAMCLAYNVEAGIKVLRNDRARRAVNIVPTAFKGHKEAGPGPYYRFDLDEARRKIEQARRELAQAGQLEEDGRIPVIKLHMTEGTAAKRIAEFARQQFAQIGVRIKPVFSDWPTLQHKVHTKQVQMYMMGWHADYYDAENFLQLFYSPNIQNGTNNSNYSNPRFDRLYEQILGMPDTPKRTELYARMIRLVSNDCPVLMENEPMTIALYYDWYQNVLMHPIGYGFGKFRRIDAPLRARLGGRK